MATAPDVRRWDELFAAANARRMSAKGSRRSSPCSGVPDLISFAGGFPDPRTFPRERTSAAARGVRGVGRGDRVPVRADARARRAARRARVAARGDSGPTPGRRRAADHERRDRGARARRQDVPRPRRPRRRRGADVPRRDHGVPRLRGEVVAVPMDEHGPRRRRARAARSQAACARSSSTRFPDHQNPAGVSLRPSGARRSSSSRAGTAS